MAPPRLTGALRSFSTVSKQEDLSLELYDLKARHNLFSEQMFVLITFSFADYATEVLHMDLNAIC